jgi:hypothetical protein
VLERPEAKPTASPQRLADTTRRYQISVQQNQREPRKTRRTGTLCRGSSRVVAKPRAWATQAARPGLPSGPPGAQQPRQALKQLCTPSQVDFMSWGARNVAFSRPAKSFQARGCSRSHCNVPNEAAVRNAREGPPRTKGRLSSFTSRASLEHTPGRDPAALAGCMPTGAAASCSVSWRPNADTTCLSQCRARVVMLRIALTLRSLQASAVTQCVKPQCFASRILVCTRLGALCRPGLVRE